MKRTLGFVSLALLLTSCQIGQFSFSPYSYGKLNESVFETSEKDGYAKVGEFSSLPYKEGTIAPTLYDVYSHSSVEVIPSIGKQKILVIPVDFESCPSSSLPSDALERIDAAFFGSENCNQYASVASFYETSSYSRLQLEGKVEKQWFRSPLSLSELQARSTPKACKTALSSIYQAALTWHEKTFKDDPLSSYAFKNKEGKEIIPVFFVYSSPYVGMDGASYGRDSMMWAFTINDPAPISWASYFMMNPSSQKMDAHTYIHETAHLFGLKDYYAKDLSQSSPTGRADMLDCSMGDLSAFSKLCLGWIRPYVVKQTSEVVLHQFASNGDCLLLTSSWNGTPFDEYLLLEFVTPTLLNHVDAFYRSDDLLRLPSTYGIKVTHVDARLGLFNMEGAPYPLSYLSKDTSLSSGVLDFGKSNNNGTLQGEFIGTDNLLCHVLDASSSSAKLVKNFIVSDKNADIVSNGETYHLRKAYFEKGTTMPNDFSFHDKTSVPFTFEVTEIAAGYGKVKVTLS